MRFAFNRMTISHDRMTLVYNRMRIVFDRVEELGDGRTRWSYGRMQCFAKLIRHSYGSHSVLIRLYEIG